MPNENFDPELNAAIDAFIEEVDNFAHRMGHNADAIVSMPIIPDTADAQQMAQHAWRRINGALDVLRPIAAGNPAPENA